MNELKIFENNEFGKIRVEVINKEPYFVAKDVCDILELTNITESLKRIDGDELSTTEVIDSIGRTQKTYIVNESGLYNLIFQSRKENAKKFKKWVTSEVLPSIRKNGGYIAGQETLTDEQLLSKALMVAQNKIQEKDRQLEQQRHKVLFADSVTASKKSILIREMSKYLSQNGIDIGEKRLFELLRFKGYLINKYGADYNTPTQKAMDLGIFEVKKTSITRSYGYTTISCTPMVTGKGQVYLMNKFLKEEMYI